ncbi:MAG: radical SAM protein, partial [Planctomycetota bacterium]|nr:radical SAM protein [Planctomycetota bacterium]
MIPRSPARAQDGCGWQRLWREAFTEPRALLAWLGLERLAAALPPKPPHGFAMRVPRPFAARMRRGDPRDPLLRQVLPLRAELDEIEGYGADAVGDLAARRARGLLVKYRGRALLIATGACAVHCRYCFRRHFPYGEEHAGADRWRAALAALAADPGLRELILSGGDPLSLATARLAELAEGLRAIPHLRTLRIHTRLPVVLPARVDGELLDWLSALPWRRVVVIHANHPAELDGEVAAACRALADAGCILLNQAVLLRG